MVKYVRTWFQAPSQASLTPVEILPGSAVQSDEEITTAAGQLSVPTLRHTLGTYAKIPLKVGRVVGPDLLVHGVQGLSVIDANIRI